MRITIIPFLIIFGVLLFITCDEPTKSNKSNEGKIVFRTDRDSDGSVHIEIGTKCEIYVMDLEGSSQTRLTFNETWDRHPIFSPDGQKILYESLKDWLMSDIFIMDINGNNQMNLTEGQEGRLPCFSPDGSKIAYQCGGIICIMDADGSNKSQLTNWELEYWYSLGQDAPLQFFPDGKKLLFFSNRDDGKADIYMMNIDGSNIIRLTNSPGYDGSAKFSPDGLKILFISYRDGKGEIYTMNTDGSNQTQLTNTVIGNGFPQYSPDGKRIVFESYRDGDSQIYIMDTDGSNQTRLTFDTENNSKPIFSPDGSKIVFVSGMNLDFDIYMIDIDGSHLENLTDNTSFDSDPQFQPQP